MFIALEMILYQKKEEKIIIENKLLNSSAV